MANQKRNTRQKIVPVTVRSMKKKNKDDGEPFCCPKCQQMLIGLEAVRLRSCKLTKHMQKLLRKKEQDEKNLTERQQELLKRALQRCSVLAMKCCHCQWQAEVKLQSRESLRLYRTQLRHKADLERQIEHQDSGDARNESLDKKAQKKLKKKEKRKKAAESKAKELQQFKRLSGLMNAASESERSYDASSSTPLSLTPLSSTPLSSTPLTSTPLSLTPLTSTPLPSTPLSSAPPVELISPFPSPALPVTTNLAFRAGKSMTFVTPSPSHTKAANRSCRLTPQSDRLSSSRHSAGQHRKGKQSGKQQLRQVLSQKKKENLSASESISQFLNSLK